MSSANRGRAVLIALGSVWLFLATGICFYHFVEGWGVIDSLYFCTVVLTTVGYGDLTPTRTVSKMFTVLYVILAISIILAIVSYLVDLIVEKNEEMLLNALATQVEDETPLGHLTKEEKSSIAASLGIFAVVCFVGGAFFHVVDGFSLLDAVYFVVITSSTVGFGDMDPQTRLSRGFAVFFLVLSTLSLARAVGVITGARAAVKQREVAHRTLTARFTNNIFMEMDKDGDGEVDRLEFLTVMLMKLGKVDKETVDDILEEFDERDVDHSGTISLAEAGLTTTKSKYRRTPTDDTDRDSRPECRVRGIPHLTCLTR
eukprot:CAMPEP_0198358310 /NCGR_PEP_ID=MMETSP1450-20131203/130207_1 /TAXON_ID=753684 ORGANISM="Madagascaria erythrocladiodes, Strain CCMP3234" /NCGR_SAMPLE_ID=MMETSP1450 /ASSEMBLY_ACC=CAM_ASM_001115 /LENGTH=314 /DNA_ID=CAMNT_0044065029 /DNA_START=26 /DNA_END=968 /DNA_ORIENTATION=+